MTPPAAPPVEATKIARNFVVQTRAAAAAVRQARRPSGRSRHGDVEAEAADVAATKHHARRKHSRPVVQLSSNRREQHRPRVQLSANRLVAQKSTRIRLSPTIQSSKLTPKNTHRKTSHPSVVQLLRTRTRKEMNVTREPTKASSCIYREDKMTPRKRKSIATEARKRKPSG